MLPKCRQAVDEAAKLAGRAVPTAAQYERIEALMSNAMRQLARQDPAGWRVLTRDQQMRAGGERAMQQIADEAARKLENAHRQIIKVAETERRIDVLRKSFADTPGHDGTRAEALKRDFALTNIGIAADRKIAQGQLFNLIEAAGDKKWAGLGRKMLMTMFSAENPGMTRDIVREIFKNADGHTGNEVASTAARAWLDTIEGLRSRFNAAGAMSASWSTAGRPIPGTRPRFVRGATPLLSS